MDNARRPHARLLGGGEARATRLTPSATPLAAVGTGPTRRDTPVRMSCHELHFLARPPTSASRGWRRRRRRHRAVGIGHPAAASRVGHGQRAAGCAPGAKGGYGPLNPILFSPQKKACARLFPTSSHRQPVRVAEALRIGPGAKARVVHLWATCRWHPARRASS